MRTPKSFIPSTLTPCGSLQYWVMFLLLLEAFAMFMRGLSHSRAEVKLVFKVTDSTALCSKSDSPGLSTSLQAGSFLCYHLMWFSVGLTLGKPHIYFQLPVSGHELWDLCCLVALSWVTSLKVLFIIITVRSSFKCECKINTKHNLKLPQPLENRKW